MGLDQLSVVEDVQAGTVEAEGDFLPGERLAEPIWRPAANMFPLAGTTRSISTALTSRAGTAAGGGPGGWRVRR